MNSRNGKLVMYCNGIGISVYCNVINPCRQRVKPQEKKKQTTYLTCMLNSSFAENFPRAPFDFFGMASRTSGRPESGRIKKMGRCRIDFFAEESYLCSSRINLHLPHVA